MAEIIEIHQKRYFTLDEARHFLPVIRRVTQTAYERIKLLSTQISYVSDPQQKQDLEKRVTGAFQDWYDKIRKLGCESKGLWLVDFDNGEGYYCWHYPEEEVNHFHGYSDGYQGRVRIQ